ncbi:MAG: FAD-binding oxidoreductase [Thermoplasmata archaeon]|nr:FAD-binding oxidoreductase [Thermoplasmata archaeon]MCI4361975.1 FAD-binding oxidoreductase [Thermoplasmata archaeon]
MTDSPRDVVVLGAGIAGAALADHLAKRSLTVTVVDPRTPAAGASGRAAGIVTEQLWNPWDVAVTRESREEYRALAEAKEPEAFLSAPFVRLTSEPSVATALHEAVERLRGWGVAVEELRAEELRRWFPQGRFERLAGAIASDGDACVTPSTITSLYLARARERGVETAFGASVDVPHRSGGMWSVVAGPSHWRARTVVVAAGAWSKRLLRDMGRPLPLTPYRTQAAVLRPPGTTSLGGGASLHDLDTDVYARPEANGRILAGDGTEKFETDPDRFITGADTEFLVHLAGSLGRWVPEWGTSEVVGAWAGVCTATPDRRPCIGALDPESGLYVLTGFNGFGVMRAGGAARRLADLIAAPTSESARAALVPVRPDRFGGRADPFPPKAGFTLEGGSHPRF